MANPLRSVGRAAVAGLALGLGCAAVALGVLAVLRLDVDCATLSPAECDFETGLSRGVARLQASAALGCALVAGGLLVALRRSR
jgi:hypothetical protein